MIQLMLPVWPLVPLLFLKPAWTSGISQFTYCWSLAWRILNITLLECENENEVAQSCPTLCHPMDCSLLGFSIRGIFQARVLEWVVISFSGASSQPRDRTWIFRIAGRHFTIWVTRTIWYFIYILALPFTGRLALCKLINLSKSQFLHL